MGTCYCCICHDCKKFIDLDKFYSWAALANADHSNLDNEDLEDYKTDMWIYKALRLQLFIHTHNGHRIEVGSEHHFDGFDNETGYHPGYIEQYPWPKGLRKFIEEIDMPPSIDRIIINTHLGKLYIDNRKDDINCFRTINGKRVDTKLLKRIQPAHEPDAE